MQDALLGLASDVGRRTRAEGLAGRTVTLKIRLAGFETHTRRHTLDQPTNHDSTIFRTALELTAERRFRSKAVRLIGVGLSIWEDSGPWQMDLFHAATDLDKANKLYAALDAVQGRFGEGSLRLGMPKHKRLR